MRIYHKYFAIIISILMLSSCQKESRKIQNIESFAKLYGYARWFHPSDEAQEIDWEKFAILGIQKVENIKSDTELKDTLFHLFSPIVQGLQITNTKSQETIDLNLLIPPNFSDNKVVAWQHSGVNLGKKSNIYKSVRTNKASNETYSFFSKFVLDATKLRGKEVKLTGYFKIKLNDSGGKAFLYLCPFNENEIKKYTSLLLTKGIINITSTEWKKYEVIYKVGKNIKYIYYGGALKNEISLYADDFEFSVKKGTSWVSIDSLNMDFELGEINDNLNNWQFDEQGHKIELTDIGPYSGKFALIAHYTGKQFEEMPKFGETINEPIGNNLYCIVPLALYEKNKTTYPITNEKLLSALKEEISNVNISSGFNKYSNLASVIISWNVFQHFYPYFDVVKVDWQNILLETIEKTYSNDDNKTFTKTLSEMVAKLEDGHGVVYGKRMYHLPIRTEWIEDNIVITASNNPNLKVGDIIKKADNLEAQKVLEEMEKLISGSPQLKRHRALNVFGSKFESEHTNISIERDGEIKSFDIQNINTTKNIFFNSINEMKCRYDTIKEIESGIFYVHLGNCTYEDILNQSEDLAHAKSVIYDYRWGGKLNLTQLIPHLIKTSVNSAWWNMPQIIYPNGEKMNFYKTNWSLEPKLPFFKSKSIIITAPCVVSSGETSMGIIDHYNLATTVGEPTAGCNGNANYINLPNGFRIMWTGMKVLKHDGSQHHLIGFQPDYPVTRTLQGVKNGRDEVLEKAIEIAKNKNASLLHDKNTIH